MEIEAAVLTEPGSIDVRTLELDGPKPNEVLVDVKATGVCHTDYHRYSGDADAPLPIVLGHEGAGIVEAIGDSVTNVSVGDPVVLAVNPSCGSCPDCVTGEPYLCEIGNRVAFSGTMMDGTMRLSDDAGPVNHFFAQSSFATKCIVPERSAVRISSDVSLESASLLGCGATTGIGGIINTADVSAGETVAVFGCGGVGASAIMAADAIGASDIIAIDTMPEKLDLVESLGATETVDASNTDPVERIVELSDGGVDYAFEFVGQTPVMAQAFEATAQGGTTVITGEAKPGDEMSVEALQFLKSKRIVGNRAGSCRPQEDIPRFVEMHDNGKLDLDRLLTRTYNLSEIEDAFAAMESGEVIRSAITFD